MNFTYIVLDISKDVIFLGNVPFSLFFFFLHVKTVIFIVGRLKPPPPSPPLPLPVYSQKYTLYHHSLKYKFELT